MKKGLTTNIKRWRIIDLLSKEKESIIAKSKEEAIGKYAHMLNPWREFEYEIEYLEDEKIRLVIEYPTKVGYVTIKYLKHEIEVNGDEIGD